MGARAVVERAIALRRHGLTIHEIAAETGASKSAIQVALAEAEKAGRLARGAAGMAPENVDLAGDLDDECRAGHDRGPTVTTSMAKRLMALHAAVREGVLTQTSQLMREGRLQEAERALCKVKGVGPMEPAGWNALVPGRLARCRARAILTLMRDKTDLDREFEEHERECFAEQARMYRALTDEERLAIFFADCRGMERFEVLPETRARARALRDRERDALFERLDEALG